MAMSNYESTSEADRHENDIVLAASEGYNKKMQTRVIFGSLESIDIPSLRAAGVVAKVDTGAWSGAIHCTDIREIDGRLHFTPLGDAALATSITDFELTFVRSANGQKEDRYVIPLEFVIQGKAYQTTIGLSDRTLMRREMLLGRKFLLENNILVDVTRSRDDDHETEIE